MFLNTKRVMTDLILECKWDDEEGRILKKKQLRVELMGRGYAWLDTGTHESLLEAAEFISNIQKREGLKVACIEEIAFHNEWISADKVKSLAEPLMKNEYGKYLTKIVNDKLNSHRNGLYVHC